MLNRYIWWSISELELEIRSTQEQLDKAVTRASTGDSDVSFALQASLESKLEQLYRAARAIDPDKYPVETTTRIDRTRAIIAVRT